MAKVRLHHSRYGPIVPPFCRMKVCKTRKYVKGYLPPGAHHDGRKSKQVSFTNKTRSTTRCEYEAIVECQMWLWKWAVQHESSILSMVDQREWRAVANRN